MGRMGCQVHHTRDNFVSYSLIKSHISCQIIVSCNTLILNLLHVTTCNTTHILSKFATRFKELSEGLVKLDATRPSHNLRKSDPDTRCKLGVTFEDFLLEMTESLKSL